MDASYSWLQGLCRNLVLNDPGGADCSRTSAFVFVEVFLYVEFYEGVQIAKMDRDKAECQCGVALDGARIHICLPPFGEE
jgi:hypothetical protein